MGTGADGHFGEDGEGVGELAGGEVGKVDVDDLVAFLFEMLNCCVAERFYGRVGAVVPWLADSEDFVFVFRERGRRRREVRGRGRDGHGAVGDFEIRHIGCEGAGYGYGTACIFEAGVAGF